jgi:hypothetical protein
MHIALREIDFAKKKKRRTMLKQIELTVQKK